MNQPLISVIIPVYKAEKYIHRCIKSVLNQTYNNFELILVDDGSPDNSGKICDDYALTDSRIKVIHKQNGGVSSARNAGIDAASGEYINFIDSDDWVPVDSLENLYIALIENDADLSVGGYQTRALKIKRYSLPNKVVKLNKSNDISDLLRVENGAFHSSCGKLFKKIIIKTFGLLFNTKIKQGEDCLFVRQYLKNCNNIVTIKSNVYYYNLINGFSASKKVFEDMALWSLDLVHAYFDLVDLLDVSLEEKLNNKAEHVISRLNFCLVKYSQIKNKKEALGYINKAILLFKPLLTKFSSCKFTNEALLQKYSIISKFDDKLIYDYYNKINKKNCLKLLFQRLTLAVFGSCIEKKRDGLI